MDGGVALGAVFAALESEDFSFSERWSTVSDDCDCLCHPATAQMTENASDIDDDLGGWAHIDTSHYNHDESVSEDGELLRVALRERGACHGDSGRGRGPCGGVG